MTNTKVRTTQLLPITFTFNNKASAIELKPLHFSYHPYFPLSLLDLDFLFIIQKGIAKGLKKLAFVYVLIISLWDYVHIIHWERYKPYRQNVIFSPLNERLNKNFSSEIIENYSFDVGIKKYMNYTWLFTGSFSTALYP